MKRRLWITLALLSLLPMVANAEDTPAAKDTRCYELRTYHAAPGKLEALLERFRTHTTALFEKHGMTNVGYWVPVENPGRQLIYFLSYPDRAAREASWKAFGADPAWQAVAKASEADGKLVDKIDSRFFTTTDFSPAVKPTAPEKPRLYELRTYTAEPGRLPNLLTRFRDHTVALFSKHGMKHFGYWTPEAKDPGADTTLVYLLIHDSAAAQAASFQAFRADPEWIKVRAASEAAAGGSLTIPDGVTSLALTPTDFSPAR